MSENGGQAEVTERRIGGLWVAQAGVPAGVGRDRDGRQRDRDRTPILFLHGIGSSAAAFTAQLTHFGSDRWCLAPDAPGYARSDDDHDIKGLEDYVDRFIGLLDAVGAVQADVVGVSWGGVIATALAAGHRDRVRRLVLVDTSRGSGVSPERADGMRARVSTFEAEGVERFSRARSPRLLAASAPTELLDSVATTMIESIRLPGYRQAAESMADTDNTDALAAIDVPTLVVVGSEDVICPPAEAERLVELIPGAALETIENAGHLTNQERPDVFNRVVGRFLSD